MPLLPVGSVGRRRAEHQEDMTLQEPDCHEKLPSELKVPEDPNLHPCCPILAENPCLEPGVSSLPRPILSHPVSSTGWNSPGPVETKFGVWFTW